MGANQSKDFYIRVTNDSGKQKYRKQNDVQKGDRFVPIPEITLSLVLSKLLLGVKKVFIALKFQVYQFSNGLFGGKTMPWFKLGIVGIAIFILTKKDIQFSINMKAPLRSFVSSSGESPKVAPAKLEELSLAQNLSLGQGKEVRKPAATIDQLSDQKVKAYINRFSQVARVEMKKFGIPASVKMAQAIIESWANEHEAAQRNNNHFGKPMDGKVFDSAWENWRAHSHLLRKYYAELFTISTDPRQWAQKLQKLNYTDDPNYEQKLLDVIQNYQLYNLDAG